MTTPNNEWNAAVQAVLKKASTDADFRAKCLSDPAAAIKEATGIELTANAGIKFSEQPEGSSIVLPPLGSDPDEILDAELLDEVAGGGGAVGSNFCKSVQWCG